MTNSPGEGRIRRIEIDGIPTYWLPDGRRRMAALQFRVGRSDEPFAQMGITHIVEHLAFFTLRPREFQANGFVDNIRTVFHVAGGDDDIRDFLAGIGAALQNLPLDRLIDESRILRTEARHRTPAIWEQLAWFRYGAVGHGSLPLPEYGLHGLTREAVLDWARDWFSAGNAALWIAGPIPDGIRINLPPGDRKPIPPAIPIADLGLPAWAACRIPGIALGLVVPRASAPTMAGRILTKRLEQHLRYELGHSYEVSLAYQPLDAKEGQSSIFASCLDEDAEKVRTAFLSTLDELLHRGPTEEELDADRAAYQRAWDDPDSGYGEVDRTAHSDLVGYPIDTAAELAAEMRAVTPEEARAALETAVNAGLMIGPLTKPPHGLSARQWSAYPSWSTTEVVGQRHDPAARTFPWQPRTEELVTGRDGVTWLDQAGHRATVRYAHCVGMVIETDGARVLYGADGFRVRVKAEDWKKGAAAVAAIEASVPADRVVRIAS